MNNGSSIAIQPSASSSIKLGSIAPSTSNYSVSGTSTSVGSSFYSSTSSNSSGSDSGYFGGSMIIWSLLGGLFVLITINVVSHYITGKWLFGEELINMTSSVTGGISTFFNNLMNSTEIGGKGAVEVGTGTVKSTASIPDQIVKGSQVSQNNSTKINESSASNAESINDDTKLQPQNSLTTKINSSNIKSVQNNTPSTPQEIDYSGPKPNKTNSPSTSGSSIGYCYIGEYNGTRSCASIDDSTKCMSGNIFDTEQKCITK